MPHPLAGVYAAAVTPLHPDSSIDQAGIVSLLNFLAQRGCHGALLLGTTGEGPSFSSQEREVIFRAALEVRQAFPDFRLLAGTGTPSLEETILLTGKAFDLGFDGVVVLPPYYFRKVSDDGLFAWFSQVLRHAVPQDGHLLGYHIPPVSGVPLSLDLLERLKAAFPNRFAGIKDSSGDPEHARQLGERFGSNLLVLNGTDSLFSFALENGADGCITALANLFSPELRQVWDSAFSFSHDPNHSKELARQAQAHLVSARKVLEKYPPASPLLKAMLHHFHGFPVWSVRVPLLLMPAQAEAQAAVEMESVVNV